MLNYRTQEMIIFLIFFFHFIGPSPGGRRGTDRVKQNKAFSVQDLAWKQWSQAGRARCSARGFGLYWTMTVCSSVAELAVNKKQPAEMRFMKSSAPQNMTLTSPGSTNTLRREAWAHKTRKRHQWTASLFTFTPCAKSELGPEHAAPKITVLSRGSYTLNSKFEKYIYFFFQI